MRRVLVLTTVLVCALLTLSAPAAAMPPVSVEVTIQPNHVSTMLGERFTITTELTNTSTSATGALLAHLNVASIEGSVYVDPEDWSSDRSQELSLQPGESRMLSWEIQSVNAGSFAAYVVVLPFGQAVVGQEELAVSPLARLEVAPRSTLTAGGALPVVLLVPFILGLAAAGARFPVWRRSVLRRGGSRSSSDADAAA